MVRDQIRPDKDYFDKAIASCDDEFAYYVTAIRENRIAPQFTQRRCELYWLFEIVFNKLVARYSRGDAVEELPEEYHRVMALWTQAIKANPDLGCYYDCMYLISWGILLDTLEPYREVFAAFIPQKERFKDDWLLHFLLTGERTGRKLAFERAHKELKAVVEASTDDERIALLKRYFQYWYQKNAGADWHDTHKITHDPLYMGYWSFESAAIVKMLGIDDSMFQNRKYYPYDLVHYKD